MNVNACLDFMGKIVSRYLAMVMAYYIKIVVIVINSFTEGIANEN